MKETQYKDFSLRTHKKNWLLNKPNVCQFELTFGCNLHCRHCYTDCYNKPAYLKKELKTKDVKFILDRVYNAGVIWLCLTGGDPLTRRDFPDIYAYAKAKGFIIIVFTNGYSMTGEIAGYFKKQPPFSIEITLNAVTEDLYEKISGVKGSFDKTMKGINLMLKEKLPLKIKTEVTRDNLEEVPGIKKFITGLGLKFSPGSDLHARLNGDLAPCNLRISPFFARIPCGPACNAGRSTAGRLPQGGSSVAGAAMEDRMASLASQGSAQASPRRAKMPRGFLRRRGYAGQVPRGASPREILSSAGRVRTGCLDEKSGLNRSGRSIFHCAIGSGDSFHIDPSGNTFPCNLIRKPSFNLLKADIWDTLNKLFSMVRNRKYTTDSKCSGCNLRALCRNCPGMAYLEKGDMEAPIEDYCELARTIASIH